VTDDGLSQVWGEAPAERAAEAGWEPPDWDAVLRLRRRAEWFRACCPFLALVVVNPLEPALVDRPSGVSWCWLGSAIAAICLAWPSLFTRVWSGRTRRARRSGSSTRCATT
jgi:hypothetical protein